MRGHWEIQRPPLSSYCEMWDDWGTYRKDLIPYIPFVRHETHTRRPARLELTKSAGIFNLTIPRSLLRDGPFARQSVDINSDKFGFFFADLDKLKWINDTIGHQEGDMALFETARVLKDIFRETDIISRMGGDEFAVLAIDINDETAKILLSRLQSSLNAYNVLETRKYALSLSVGVAQYDPQNPVSLDVLISRADTLMYEEKRKRQGRNLGETRESLGS